MHFFVFWTGNWRRWARNRRRSLTWRPATAAQRPSATSAPNSTANVRATPSGRPSNQPPTPVSLEGGGSRPPPMGRDPRERERERERQRPTPFGGSGRPLSGSRPLSVGRRPPPIRTTINCYFFFDAAGHPSFIRNEWPTECAFALCVLVLFVLFCFFFQFDFFAIAVG